MKIFLRYHRWKIIGFLCLFCFGFYIGLTGGFVQTDDGWLVQVASRLVDGDILYREIYFGMTPLSIYIISFLTKIFGVEIIILRILLAVTFAVAGLLTYHVARQLNINLQNSILVVLISSVYQTPDLLNGTLYTPLSYLLLLVTFSLILHWHRNQSTAKTVNNQWLFILLLGSSTGLCFMTKQSLGGYSALAVAALIIIHHLIKKDGWKPFFLDACLALGTFLLVVILLLTPIFTTGSWSKFIEYILLNKRTYLEVGEITYLSQLSSWISSFTSISTTNNIRAIYFNSIFFFPPVAFVVIGMLFLRRKDLRGFQALALVLFMIVGTLAILPLWSMSHVSSALPILLIGIVYSLENLSILPNPGLIRFARIGLYTWLGIGLAISILFPLRQIISNKQATSHIPHLRWLLLNQDHMEEIIAVSKKVREIVKEDKIFLATQYAGIYYLSTGFKNPTPYDVPLLPAFGLTGEQETIDAIKTGKITYVCLRKMGSHPRRPVLLESFVLRNMQVVKKLSICTLYKVQTDP